MKASIWSQEGKARYIPRFNTLASVRTRPTRSTTWVNVLAWPGMALVIQYIQRRVRTWAATHRQWTTSNFSAYCGNPLVTSAMIKLGRTKDCQARKTVLELRRQLHAIVYTYLQLGGYVLSHRKTNSVHKCSMSNWQSPLNIRLRQVET